LEIIFSSTELLLVAHYCSVLGVWIINVSAHRPVYGLDISTLADVMICKCMRPSEVNLSWPHDG